jgi:hypothetical protein
MKIRGNTVGTAIKPEQAVVKCKNLTEEQKAQARENIGAVDSIYVDNAVKDKAYELIDTITFEEDAALNLTQEPDGSPIKFSRVMLLCDITNSPGIEIWTAFPGTSTKAPICNWSTNATKQACYSEAWVKNGYWRFEWAYNGNYYVLGSINRIGYNRIVNYKATGSMRYISGLSSGKALPAGTVLKIYAVRYEGE